MSERHDNIAEPMPADEFVRKFVRTGRPVLIKGLVKDWAAVSKWSAGYLADFTESIGDLEVDYRSTPDDMPRMDVGRLDQGKKSLLEILRECESSPAQGREIYIPGLNLP